MPRPKPEKDVTKPPLTPVWSTRFTKDAKLAAKRGKDMARFAAVLDSLEHRRPLALEFKDHALSGNWQGYRECHVQPDFLVVYRTTETELRLARAGSHSDLFSNHRGGKA